MVGGAVSATAIMRGPKGWTVVAVCPRCGRDVRGTLTLDLCRALCACGYGFEIDALDAPLTADGSFGRSAADSAQGGHDAERLAAASTRPTRGST